MSHSFVRKALVVGIALGAAASISLGVTDTAFADAPTSTLSTTVGFIVPGSAAPGSNGFDIKGDFWGLRPGESAVGYGVKVSCTDGFSVSADLTPFGPVEYEGTVATIFTAHLPVHEVNQLCRLETSAPAGKLLQLDSGIWSFSSPNYVFSSIGMISTVVTTHRGGQY